MNDDFDKPLTINNRVYLAAFRRLRLIDRELARAAYPNAGQLADLLGVTARTVKRDIAFMRDDLNAPINFSRGRGGYYYALEGWSLPPVRLSEGDLLAFFIAENALKMTGHTPEALHLKHALTRLASLLPEEVSINLATLGENVSFQNLPFLTADPQILQRVAQSAAARETIEFDYYSPHTRENTRRRADVHLLHNFMGYWYAISHDYLRGEFRDFHVGRISNLRETGRAFELQKNWNAETYLRGGFYMTRGGRLTTVEIHFDSYQAQWIRERRFFHPEEEREELPDGSLRLRFKIGEKGLEAVARFCLQYAGNFVAVKPEKLREIIRGKLQKGLEQHL
jgi:predicted DNA-binding transcriptional regulator YafY